jgi:Ulp1 family protease
MFDKFTDFMADLENCLDDNQPIGKLTSSNGRQQQITKRDLQTLRRGEYLNDTIIETYLQLIANNCNGVPETRKKVGFFRSYAV